MNDIEKQIKEMYVSAEYSRKELAAIFNMSFDRVNKILKGIRPDILSKIKKEFANAGYELVSNEYINSKSKLKYLCPKHGLKEISWNSFQAGSRCMDCYRERVMPTIQEIRKEFSNAGYKLLDTKYINASTKLTYICPNHGRKEISWKKFREGQRCADCHLDSLKYDINEIRTEFQKAGYKLISKEYVNSLDKLTYICPNHGKKEISWSRFRSGNRCDECATEQKRHNIDYVRAVFKKNGYELLTGTYLSRKSELEYLCPKHGKQQTNWANFKSNNFKCLECKLDEEKEKKYTEIKQAFDEAGYKLLSKEYVNYQEKLRYICPEHGAQEISWDHFSRGQRCPKCSHSDSIIKRAEENKNKWKDIPATTYCILLKGKNEVFLKIGVTRRIPDRFEQIPYSYTILELVNTNLYNGTLIEQKILKKYNNNKYIPKIKFGGYTECINVFSLKDIVLDMKQIKNKQEGILGKTI